METENLQPVILSGHIFQINASKGGVPKLPLSQSEVTHLGLANDRHDHPEIHGGPTAALCLYSLEHILALQQEGHPIYPGSIGENLTLAGLDWSRVVPGICLRLGEEVLVEITQYTSPCNTISGSFLDKDYGRVSQKQHPGWSRVYARVLQTGRLRVGDRVERNT